MGEIFCVVTPEVPLAGSTWQLAAEQVVYSLPLTLFTVYPRSPAVVLNTSMSPSLCWVGTVKLFTAPLWHEAHTAPAVERCASWLPDIGKAG